MSTRDPFLSTSPPLRFGPLLALGRRVLGCPDLASDALQEALVALWQADPPPDRPPAWLPRAVVRRSLQLLRSQGRRRDHECRARPACAWSQEPSRPLELRELGQRLAGALEALEPEFRQAFLLHQEEELDYAAIARREQVPVGTVRSRIHRARRHLRRALERRAV